MDRTTFQQNYGILGTSVEMQEIIDVVQQVAPTDITVLITGESGVGKEILARPLHAASKRAEKTLVNVNCGAIPEGLIESEIFGHEKGSFTSAVDTRKGYFEIADGGTIFLDEIGEMPLATQVKRFRPDLYFRLRSVNIWIPPLRERREDIPVLLDHFARECSQKNGVPFQGFTDEAREILVQYRWPGSVRELRNVIESMIVLEKGKRIGSDELRKYLQGYAAHVV